MLMLMLGVNDAIEIYLFFSNVNASVNTMANADARCYYTLKTTGRKKKMAAQKNEEWRMRNVTFIFGK